MSSRTALLFFLVLGAAAPATAQGKVFLTTDEALELAFPKCKIDRKTHVLDEKRQERVETLCGSEFAQGIVFAYEAHKDGKLVGTAYFDAHRVRTLKETLMVVVDPEGKVARIEVLAFAEPTDYMPRTNFYAQFVGHGLDEDLHLKRSIRGVTGATLTARATVDSVRRLLAVDAVLRGEPKPEPRPRPDPVGNGK